jgi:microcystin-dependent protein
MALALTGLIFCGKSSFSQSLAINADGSTANGSAVLDVKSTVKGILIPRMSTVQKNAVTSPATGLEVYDTDLNQFYYWNGTVWVAIANNSNYWTLSGGNIYNNTGTNVGIGAVTPLAKLTVEGTDDAGPQDLFKLSKVDYGSTIFYQYYTDAGNWGTKMRGSSGPAPAFIFNMENGRFGIGTSAPSANLEVIGTFKVTDGSQGANKILTSDAAGLASWQNPSEPAGSIIMYGGAATPAGYLSCDGSAVNRITYAALFTAIGVAWGNGDGATTFNLPDLRGRFPRGVAGVSGNDPDAALRTASNSGGNTGNNVGSLQTDTLMSHYHDVGAFTGAGGTHIALVVTGTNATHAVLGTENAGGNETRPKNVYVSYIIRY